MNKKYYEILNVKNDANLNDIKTAFKKMATIYHPDKNSDPKAEELFKEINEAYQTLSDDNKRKEYDKTLKFNNVFKSYKDFYEENNDIVLGIKIPLKDIYLGLSKKITYNKKENNILVKDSIVIDNLYNIIKENKLKYSKKGHVGLNSIGDLIINVEIDKDNVFGNINVYDLTITLKIDFIKMLNGGTHTLVHIDGKFLNIKIPKHTKPSQMLKVVNKGLYKNNNGDRGDLYITIELDLNSINDDLYNKINIV
jgi:DnaJ-class molecular chaperone